MGSNAKLMHFCGMGHVASSMVGGRIQNPIEFPIIAAATNKVMPPEPYHCVLIFPWWYTFNHFQVFVQEMRSQKYRSAHFSSCLASNHINSSRKNPTRLLPYRVPGQVRSALTVVCFCPRNCVTNSTKSPKVGTTLLMNWNILQNDLEIGDAFCGDGAVRMIQHEASDFLIAVAGSNLVRMICVMVQQIA